MNYYYARKNTIELVIFSNYMIEQNGVIRNNKTGEIRKLRKNAAGYNVCCVCDNSGKLRNIQVGRALASLRGPPPTPYHTADHIDRDRKNDTLNNIRWATRKEQNDNQVRPQTMKDALVIVKDDIEKTVNEWVCYLKDQKNHLGHEYTTNTIKQYAQKKQHGFSYKEYPDLPGEIWKEIVGSKNTKGRWEISDMNRVKYITRYAINVLSDDRLGILSGYPTIRINGKQWLCHVLAFMTFYPDKWVEKTHKEFVLHEDDNKMDFRPHKLRIGTQAENGMDAHNNGCYDGKKSGRMKCASYINGVLEKVHESQRDAVEYLKSKGYSKAASQGISRAINSKNKTAYDRTWEPI